MIPTKFHFRLLMLTVEAVFGLLLTVCLVLFFFVLSHFNDTATFPVDCAVVFGAAVHGIDNAGPGITRRVTTAVDLYHDDKVGTLFFSGGKGDEFKDSEAMVMRKVALLQGVDPEDIVLEETATSTIENIEFTLPLLQQRGCTSVVGISDRYHLARISVLARIYGINGLQTYPSDIDSDTMFELKATFREVLAFGYTFFLMI